VTRIYFANEKIRNNFEKSKTREEFLDLHRFIQRAFEDIRKKPDCGVALNKKLIPRRYITKYGINNLYKYDLPNAWRMLYSLGKECIEIIAAILEWCPHKEYEKLFHYKVMIAVIMLFATVNTVVQ